MGIPLFRNGQPIRGEVTDLLMLWNGGTEMDQEPGVGDAQAPRQPSPGFGPAENGVVVPIRMGADRFNYPPNSQVIRVTITPKIMVRKDGQ